MGKELSLLWVVPFAGMLLSLALFPLFAPKFWHHHFRKVSIGWGLILAVPFILIYKEAAIHELLHIILLDYIPFVLLLWALFTISGGILVRGTLAGTPVVNTGVMLLGTVLASWIGTTGASMLLIRPLLRANANRQYKAHTIVFFIFLVSNIGGMLTPLGDPPLFLGFLHGVPFFWTLQNCAPHMAVTAAIVATMYFIYDTVQFRREPKRIDLDADQEKAPLRLVGTFNFLLIGGVIGGVLLSGYWNPDHIHDGRWFKHGDLIILEASHGHEAAAHDGHDVATAVHSQEETHAASSAVLGIADGDTHLDAAKTLGHAHGGEPIEEEAHHHIGIPVQNLARDGILIVMGILSMFLTPKVIREENGFSWFPIVEVAWLFAGIFLTIVPALQILQAGSDGAMAILVNSVTTPTRYFWATGALSSFLDNAPTYLTFLNTAMGQFYPGMPESQALPLLLASQSEYLVAVSIGAVFMGANTYIGNAPNLMVRSIAEEAGVAMPDFFTYMFKFSIPFLCVTFVLITLLFF